MSNCYSWTPFSTTRCPFPLQTVQYQLNNLRLHKHLFNFQIVLWHDTINNSVTLHSSNFYNPLSPQELVEEEISALPCPASAIVYCHRTNSPPIFYQLSRSFLTVHAVRHLLSHRKLNNNALLHKYSELHLDISLEIRMFFLISKHISDLRLLTKKKIETQQQATTLTFPKTTSTANATSTDLTSPSPSASPYPLTPHDRSLLQSPPYFYSHYEQNILFFNFNKAFLLLVGSVAFWLLLLRLLQW